MLVIARDARFAVIRAMLAGGAVVLFLAVLGSSPLRGLEIIVAGWLPVMVLVMIWRLSRSTGLAVQMSLLLAIAVLAVAHLVGVDFEAAWQPLFDAFDKASVEKGGVAIFAALQVEYESQPDSLAVVMTTALVTMSWLLAVLEFLAGGALADKLPDETAKFGRIRSLDLGRVLAMIFVAALLLAYVSELSVFRQLGLLMFAAFLLQGFIIVHWLNLEGHAPAWVVFLVYGSIVVLMQYAVVAIAVIGYLDAVFRVRHRIEKT
jgi:hypothetical protein